MKKNIITILFFTSFIFLNKIIIAQQLYFNINFGYNIDAGNNFIKIYNTIYDDNNNRIDNGKIIKNTSYGKGVNADFGIGYKFKKSVSTEINFSYLNGGNIEYLTQQNIKVNQANGSLLYSQEIIDNNKLYSRFFRIIPTIKFNTNFNKLNPFIKFGIIIGFGSIYTEENYYKKEITVNITEKINEETTYKEWTYNGGFSIGYNTRIGVDYKINEKLYLFGEFNIISLKYSNTKGEMTKYVENGEDKLSETSTYDKEYEFVEEYSIYQNEPIDENKPRKVLKEANPFDSIGFNIGIIYRL